MRREREFLASGGRMIFPFPEIEIVQSGAGHPAMARVFRNTTVANV